jgi:peptidoglycan/LPS O-acetylase OafA/YrhL
LSMWLNVGVPIFFIISAYLLSFKTEQSIQFKPFYLQRIKSIFPSYWIYLIFIIVLLFFVGQGPNIKSIVCFGLGLFGLTDSCVLGLGHFWFITVLLICYLITPILYRICRLKVVTSYIYIVSLIVALFIIFFVWGYPSYGIHIGTYVLVYCFYHKCHGIVTRRQVIYCAVAAIVLTCIRLLIDDVMANKEYIIYYYYDALFQPLARFGLGLSIFTLFMYYNDKVEVWSKSFPSCHKLINRFSNISYEFYLTHQFILLSIWKFIPAVHNGVGYMLWILISFIATIVNAICVAYVKRLIMNVINK